MGSIPRPHVWQLARHSKGRGQEDLPAALSRIQKWIVLGRRRVTATEKNYAIFSTQYPPHMGGVEVFTQSLARELSARGNHVTVVANDTEDVGAGKTDEGGVEVFRMPCWPLGNGRMSLPKQNSATRALRRELFSRKWDGVLVNTRFYLHSLLGMKLAMDSRLVPVVLDHGSAHLSFFLQRTIVVTTVRDSDR